jgi:DNA-binding NarL/FixJ family response regulator
MLVLAIVEDDSDLRYLIRELLALVDFELVGEAASIAEAEDLLRSYDEKPVGLIVLDHALAGEVTGLEAAPRLKELAPRAKIILFTAYAHIEPLADAEEAVDAFLLKSRITELPGLARSLVDDT